MINILTPALSPYSEQMSRQHAKLEDFQFNNLRGCACGCVPSRVPPSSSEVAILSTRVRSVPPTSMTQDLSSRGAVWSGSAQSGEEAGRAIELNKRGRDRSILLKGGCVLTLDPQVGDFVKADVLIRGSKIAAVAPNIEADAEIIDATDTIVMPGFVDSHRHCWQGMFRRFAPNATVNAYGRDINKIGDVIRPEDVYIGNLSSCVNALDTGVTTLLDWSHISNTPAHSDAAIEGLRASGMRAVYAFGQSRISFRGPNIQAICSGSNRNILHQTTSFLPCTSEPISIGRIIGPWRENWAFP